MYTSKSSSCRVRARMSTKFVDACDGPMLSEELTSRDEGMETIGVHWTLFLLLMGLEETHTQD